MIKKLMSKKANIFGKKIPILMIALIALIGVASATLLVYYGTITANVVVQQSILLDGKDVNTGSLSITDTILEAAPGGEAFCFAHNLENKMSVSGKVGLTVTGTPNLEGITTTFLGSVAPYAYNKNIVGLGVKVEDTVDGWLKWTYTYSATPTHTPKMTVSINYPSGFAITTFDDGSHDGWYYAPDVGAEVKLGDYAGYDGSTSGYDWVKTTASGNVLTVSIKKTALGDAFHWHGYGNLDGAGVWINGGETGSGYGTPPFEVTLKSVLTPPITLASKETKEFSVCYAFEQNIWPGTYTITTNVVPLPLP